MRSFLTSLLVVSLVFSVSAQKFNQKYMDKLATDYTKLSFPLFRGLLSIPNVAENHDDIEKNIQWCEREFDSRGFKTTRIETSTVPLLLAERSHQRAKNTVLVYMQLDGQPVDTSRWDQENPFIPVIKKPNGDGGWEEIPWENINNYEDDWRIFARSASDAKGPVMMFLAALDITAAEGFMPNYNLKVIMDFEEEIGSPRLPGAVKEHIELLKSDMLIIFDGPRHLSNKPTLTFGARGIAEIGITTYGPIRPQHSGHFGNYAPNPALRLAQLLSSMKDNDGRVTIPGFYDGITIDPETEKILKAVPDDDERIKDYLQVASFDKVGSYYQEAIQYPSLNIRGMQSGWINEEVRTIVPAWAKAEIDVRLVLESDPDRLIRLIREHVEKQGFYVTDHVPTREERMTHEKVAMFTSDVSYQSFRTNFDTEVGQWLRKAMVRAFGEDPVMLRMSGGSIPISPFVKTLDIPAVTVPTVNRDNNQHSPNENLRLGNYREGIKTMVAILTEKL